MRKRLLDVAAGSTLGFVAAYAIDQNLNPLQLLIVLTGGIVLFARRMRP